MPLPKPRTDEIEDDFIARCMSELGEEFEDREQRLAVCYGQWRQKGVIMERKSIKIELKADKEGSFVSCIATLNVIDKDKDVTLAGAFPVREVLVSAYQHGSWQGRLPIGKATIREVNDEVIAEGEFNLNTETGREHYEAIKFSGELQEWSYAFDPVKTEQGEWEGEKVRFLKRVDPIEISPVLRGAGVGTTTLAIKEDSGLTFTDEAETVLAAVESFSQRAQSLAELRRKEGRALSEVNRDRIDKLLVQLTSIARDLKGMLTTTEPVDKEQAQKLLLEFLRIEQNILEVKEVNDENE